jgi:hypothetical protein
MFISILQNESKEKNRSKSIRIRLEIKKNDDKIGFYRRLVILIVDPLP